MSSSDPSAKILREIRDEISKTNERVGETNARLDQTNARLDETKSTLERAIIESEIRTATAITALGGTLEQIKDLLADRLEIRDRVDRCEVDIAAIKGRLAMK